MNEPGRMTRRASIGLYPATLSGGGGSMDRAVVAVDRDLGPYEAALRDAGYHVVPLDSARLHEASAIVVDGIDERVMGIETPLTPAPVINATGMTAEEVVREVRRRAGP
jgi:hypothetical protein